MFNYIKNKNTNLYNNIKNVNKNILYRLINNKYNIFKLDIIIKIIYYVLIFLPI